MKLHGMKYEQVIFIDTHSNMNFVDSITRIPLLLFL